MFVMLWLKADSVPLSMLWNWQRCGPNEILCLGFWLQDGATEAGLRHERSNSRHGSQAIFVDRSFQEYVPCGSANHVRLWLVPNQTAALDVRRTDSCITDHWKKINIVFTGHGQLWYIKFLIVSFSQQSFVPEAVGVGIMENKKQLLI